jgi:hypothetical protein
MTEKTGTLYNASRETVQEPDRTEKRCPTRTKKTLAHVSLPGQSGSKTGLRVEKYKRRHWAAYDAAGILVCVCVYRKGAEEVIRRVAPPAAKPD